MSRLDPPCLDRHHPSPYSPASDLAMSGSLPYIWINGSRRVKLIGFDEAAAALDEPKTARMEQRTKPHVKAEIRKAAALMGIDETAFVTNAAYERALATIRDHERTVLTAEDRDVFLAALDAPSAPSEAMRRAFDLHDRMVVDDD